MYAFPPCSARAMFSLVFFVVARCNSIFVTNFMMLELPQMFLCNTFDSIRLLVVVGSFFIIVHLEDTVTSFIMIFCQTLKTDWTSIIARSATQKQTKSKQFQEFILKRLHNLQKYFVSNWNYRILGCIFVWYKSHHPHT